MAGPIGSHVRRARGTREVQPVFCDGEAAFRDALAEQIKRRPAATERPARTADRMVDDLRHRRPRLRRSPLGIVAWDGRPFTVMLAAFCLDADVPGNFDGR